MDWLAFIICRDESIYDLNNRRIGFPPSDYTPLLMVPLLALIYVKVRNALYSYYILFFFWLIPSLLSLLLSQGFPYPHVPVLRQLFAISYSQELEVFSNSISPLFS